MSTETMKLITQIQGIMKDIRKRTPKKNPPTWLEPADLVCRADFLNGEKVNAASMTLFPTGCQYVRTGGCTMCGEWSGSNLGSLVPGEFHVAQFAAGSAQLLHEKEIHWLRIYQEGSFLNEMEVTPEAREVIFKLASNLKGIRRITVESRPEYLTQKLASEIREYTKNVELEIGIGLEAKNDFIRNVCIGKGTKLSSYNKAVNIAHANNIIALGYVILKPPFLSEKEAIEEAIESTRFAFDIGFDEVYIQAASVHEWSLSEVLARKKLYSPPWLWSMIEVVESTAHLGKVKIGGLEYFPRPAHVSQNYSSEGDGSTCSCSHDVWHLIQEFNASGEINVFRNLTCSCRDFWKASLEIPSSPLDTRIQETISALSLEEYFQSKLI